MNDRRLMAALDGFWRHIAGLLVLIGVLGGALAPVPAVAQAEGKPAASAEGATASDFLSSLSEVVSGFDYSRLAPVAALVAVFLLGLAAWRRKRADQNRGLISGVGPLEPWPAYLFAIAATTATFGLRMSLDGQLGGQPSLVIFTLPIMLSAYLGGLGAGLLATAVSYLAASYFLLPPIHSLAVASGADHWQQLFVALAGVCISGLCEMLHRARGQAEIASRGQQRAESAGRASEEQFSSSFGHSAVGMALVAPDGRFLRVNRALCEMLGYAEAELLALTYQELTFAEDLDDQGRVRRLQAGQIDSFLMEKRYRHRQGRLVTVLLSVSIVRDETGRPIHQIAQLQDITERKAHEVEIERLTRLYAALSQINQAIVWTPSRDKLFEKICQVLVEHGGFRIAWIGWHDCDQSRLVPVAAFGDTSDYLQGIQVYTDDRREGRGPTGTAFCEGRPFICNDIFNDPATQPWRAEAERQGFRASAAFPIQEQGVTRGVITVYADEAGIFQDREIALLAEAAVDVSFALDNLQREAARQRAEEANVRALQRLTEAQRIGKIGDWEFDLGTGAIIWSPQTFEILGRDPALGPPGNLEDNATLYEPASAALSAEKVAEVIATGEAREYELVARRADGQRVSMQTIAVPRKDESGRVVGLYGTVQDVSARKEAEVATARLAAIVASSDDAIIGKDLNGIVTSWNDGAERVFGYTAREMIGTSILRLIPPGRHGEEAHILATVRGGEALRRLETVRQRKDGRMIDVSVTTSPIKDATGRIIGASKIARDITDRKRAADKLQRSEASLANAQRIARIGSWDYEISTGAVVWSAEVYRMFGLNEAELGACLEVFMAAVHPEDREQVNAALGATVAHGVQYDIEHRIVRPDGTERIVHGLADPARDDEGQPAHLAGTVQDITERVQAATKLRESEAQFHTMLDAMSPLAWMADAEGAIYWYNQQWYDYTGATPQEMQGWGWQRVHDPEILPQVIERWRAAIDGGELFEMDYPLRAADGSYSWFLTRGVPLKDSSGRAVRWFGTNTDITAQREAADEIARLNANLEQRVIERTAQLAAANLELEAYSTAVTRDLRVAEAADRIKSAFLATMSHELRTPLNSIIGFTGIVLMGKAGSLNAEQKKQLEMVRESAWHLLALINDVLDLSKIEAGQVEVRAEPFDLPASIERVLAMIGPLAEKKGLRLAAEVAPALGEIVSDQRRVEQILLNLLSNAVKFTSQGRVLLTAELIGDHQPLADGPARPAVRLRVADTGIGIQSEDLLTLFQPFRQIDSGPARGTDGTGLGLAISRRLATLLGGEIAATSTWSQGSEFTVILPLERPAAP